MIRPSLFVLLGTVIAGAASPQPSRQASPDIILSNGKIVTVDERFTIARAVAVEGERILAVGGDEEIEQLAGPETRRIDLKGRAVIPGLIDNHMHLLRAGVTWQREVRWDGIDSRERALDTLRAWADASSSGQWVFNLGGWTRDQFVDEKAPFTREELDRVAPDNPVCCRRPTTRRISTAEPSRRSDWMQGRTRGSCAMQREGPRERSKLLASARSPQSFPCSIRRPTRSRPARRPCSAT